MKIIYFCWVIVFVFIFSSSSSIIAFADEEGLIEKPYVILGTEIPLLNKFPSYDCYRYKKYVVFAVPSTKEASSDSYIVPLVTGINEKDMCDINLLKKTHFISASGWFLGLYNDYVFSDEGTGPGTRWLVIVSISKQKTIYNTLYTDHYPLKLREDCKLLFYKEAEGKGQPSKDNCPAANKWFQKLQRKKKNKTLLIEDILFEYKLDEERILDLKTLREESTGKIGCSHYQ